MALNIANGTALKEYRTDKCDFYNIFSRWRCYVTQNRIICNKTQVEAD